MGRRRYRYRKPKDDDGILSQAMDVAFASPIAGVVLIVLFLIGAALCYANPTGMFGTAPLLGVLALLCAGVAVLFTLAGIVKRWIKSFSAPTRRSPNASTPRPSTPARAAAPPPRSPAPAMVLNPSREKSMLSRGEMAFYDPLREIVAGRYEILLKPSLVDVLNCRDHPRFHNIATMHVDFMLCDRQTLRPLLAIELDDLSHNTPARIAADRWKEQLLAERQIPLLRQPCEVAYDVLAVKEAIDRTIAGAAQ